MPKRKELAIWFTGEDIFGGKNETSFQRLQTPLVFKPIQIAAGNKHILVLEGLKITTNNNIIQFHNSINNKINK